MPCVAKTLDLVHFTLGLPNQLKYKVYCIKLHTLKCGRKPEYPDSVQRLLVCRAVYRGQQGRGWEQQDSVQGVRRAGDRGSWAVYKGLAGQCTGGQQSKGW